MQTHTHHTDTGTHTDVYLNEGNNTQPERYWTPRYPQLPRSVHVEGLNCETALFKGLLYTFSIEKTSHWTLKLTFDQEDQHKSIPKVGILTKVFCICGKHLVILAWTGDEYWYGQDQHGVNFYFEVKFDLGSQGQLPRWTSSGLTTHTHTHARTRKRTRMPKRHTDRQTQATTIPEGPGSKFSL